MERYSVRDPGPDHRAGAGAVRTEPTRPGLRCTDERRYFVSEATVYRLLKAHDLVASPAYVVIKAADQFHTKTIRPNEMWQTGSEAERRRSRKTFYRLQDHRVGLDVSVDRAGRLLPLHHRRAAVQHDAGRRRHRNAGPRPQSLGLRQRQGAAQAPAAQRQRAQRHQSGYRNAHARAGEHTMRYSCPRASNPETIRFAQ